MNNNHNLSPQIHIKINKKEKQEKQTKKTYEYIDINLDKAFLNKYFQDIKKKKK
jgi:hypothetical protein